MEGKEWCVRCESYTEKAHGDVEKCLDVLRRRADMAESLRSSLQARMDTLQRLFVTGMTITANNSRIGQSIIADKVIDEILAEEAAEGKR